MEFTLLICFFIANIKLDLKVKYTGSIILFFLLFSLRSSGTNDSLLKIIRSPSSHDTAVISAYYELGWEYIFSLPDSSYNFGLKALKIAQAKRYPRLESKVYNLLGACSQVNGEYLKAIEHYQKAMVIGERENDAKTLMTAYGNIGSLYINLGRYKMALEYQLKSLEIGQKTNDKEKLGSIYNNLSLIYAKFNENDKAIEYGLKSVEINKETNQLNNLCSTYGNIGNAYFNMNKHKEAIENYKKCYELAKETDNQFEKSKVILDMAEAYFSLKKYNEALTYYKEARELAKALGENENLTHTYFGMYSTYLKLKDDKEALKYLQLYVDLTKSVNKEEREKEVSQKVMEFNYNLLSYKDSLKNAQDAQIKDVIIQAGQAQIEKDKILKTALILGLIFVIAFGLIIYNRFRITRQQKVIIELKNKQTEEQKLIIEQKQKEILDSINYAKRIQDSLLENFEMVTKFFSDALLLNLPKDIVSGDFYWINRKNIEEKTEKGRNVTELFYLAVCDSTGHGVPGGFMSMLNISYISEAVNEKNIHYPNKILEFVREKLINTISKNDQKDGFDGTLLCFEKTTSFEHHIAVNTRTRLTYAAAYNSPILIRNNELTRLECDKMPVGYSLKSDQFRLFELELQKGDSIYMYTDGFPDQFGGPVSHPATGTEKIIRSGKKFQYKQLDQLLLEISKESMNIQKEKLEARFFEWKGEFDQIDDVCVIGIKI